MRWLSGSAARCTAWSWPHPRARCCTIWLRWKSRASLDPATSAQEAAYQTTGPSGEAGHVSLTVDASAADVVSFYKKTLESEGYEVSVTSFSGSGESVSIVTGQKGAGNVVASVSDKDGHTQVAVQYNSGG